MQLCVMEASESCTKITSKLFHVEILSNLKKYDKIKRNKDNQREKKPTTNQSEATALAAIYTSHQVWCLQRL